MTISFLPVIIYECILGGVQISYDAIIGEVRSAIYHRYRRDGGVKLQKELVDSEIIPSFGAKQLNTCKDGKERR